jgi:hypothetical protein
MRALSASTISLDAGGQWADAVHAARFSSCLPACPLSPDLPRPLHPTHHTPQVQGFVAGHFTKNIDFTVFVVDVFNSGEQTVAPARRSLLQSTLPTITIRFEVRAQSSCGAAVAGWL